MTNEVAELSQDVPDAANPLAESAYHPTPARPTDSAGTATTHTNEFTARKTAAHAMMDAALFMANISQLRMLFTNDSSAPIRFFVPLLCLIVFSLSCQILFAIIILMIWARETHHHPCKDPAPRASSDHPQDPPTDPSPPPNRSLLLDHSDHCSPEIQPLSPHHNSAIAYRRRLDVHHPDSSLFHGGHGAMMIEMSDASRATEEESDVRYGVITRRLQIATLLLVFLITVANMFITGLGFDPASELKPGLSSQ